MQPELMNLRMMILSKRLDGSIPGAAEMGDTNVAVNVVCVEATKESFFVLQVSKIDVRKLYFGSCWISALTISNSVRLHPNIFLFTTCSRRADNVNRRQSYEVSVINLQNYKRVR